MKKSSKKNGKYKKYLKSDVGVWKRVLTTSFLGDIAYVEEDRANNMSFFVDADGVKFGDITLNIMIIPKEVFIEAVNKFCISKIE